MNKKDASYLGEWLIKFSEGIEVEYQDNVGNWHRWHGKRAMYPLALREKPKLREIWFTQTTASVLGNTKYYSEKTAILNSMEGTKPVLFRQVLKSD